MAHVTLGRTAVRFPGQALAGAFIRKCAEWYRADSERAAIRSLEKLDERMLRDMGLSRDDVHWASRQPAGAHPTDELERIARGR